MLSYVRTANVPRTTSRRVLWDVLSPPQESTKTARLSDILMHACTLNVTQLHKTWWSEAERIESAIVYLQKVMEALYPGPDPFSTEHSINAGILDASNLWQYLCLARVSERRVSVEEDIFARYCDIEQVQAIYVQHLSKMCKVFVLLRQNQYDDKLMDHLLDREEEILDLHPNELFQFHYLPLLEGDYSRPVPKNAVLILSR